MKMQVIDQKGAKYMKKSIYVLAAVGILVLAVVNIYANEGYSDIGKSHWAYSYISNMSERGIISGYTDGSFKPAQQVTYAEFMKMVLIAQTGVDPGKPSTGHWALNYYNEGLKIGLFGRDDVAYSDLDKIIPRNKMALMVSNSMYSDKSASSSEYNNILAEINDVNQDMEYAREIAQSYSAGILNGYPDKSFKPENGLSRAEAAAAVYRLSEISENIDAGKAEHTGSETIKEGNYEVENYNTTLGYNGIKKFVYSPESKCIGVYSEIIQDISLFIDGKKAAPVVNVEGEYWKEDGYYVYVFKAEDDFSGKPIGIAFGLYIEEVYYYTDANL